MNNESIQDGPDIREYLRVLRRRKLTIAASALVLVALTLVYCFLVKPTYSASAQVLVPQQNASSEIQATNSQQAPSAQNLQRTLADDLTIAQGHNVKVASQAKLRSKAVASVSISDTADVLTFSGSSHNAAQAADIANTYAQAYIQEQSSLQVGQYKGEISSLEGTIARLRATLGSAPPSQKAGIQDSISNLTLSLQDLQAASNLSSGTAGTLVDPAQTPTHPSKPKTVEYALLALLVGLVLGVGLAFLFERLDDTIKSFDDIEDNTHALPVLATIPLVDKWRRGAQEQHLAMVEDSSSKISEAYRTLRTALQFLSIDDSRKVIGITSALPEEGKSTATANLAYSLARTGLRVVVCSMDFRKPKLHGFFGMDNSVGLTSVLLRQSSLQNALQVIPDEPRLRVLSSGPVPPNPAELLSLERMVHIVEELNDSADVVLIDCPPVLPVTDSLLISRLVDGVLVLTRAAKTKKQDLRRTVELLHQVKAPLLGIIVNGVPARGAYAYSYGYGYGYGGDSYGSTPEVEEMRLPDFRPAHSNHEFLPEDPDEVVGNGKEPSEPEESETHPWQTAN